MRRAGRRSGLGLPRARGVLAEAPCSGTLRGQVSLEWDTTLVEPIRLITMTTYSGPARLILADGTCIAGMASLSTNQRGGLNGWGGTFRPDQAGTDLRDVGDGLQLELPYERVG